MKYQPKFTKNNLRTTVRTALFVVSVITITFFVTRGMSPNTSELAFTEHSIRGVSSGSVIPASCDSSSPTSHFPGDCSTPTAGYPSGCCSSICPANTHMDIATNFCVCNNGAAQSTAPTCQPAPKVELAFGTVSSANPFFAVDLSIDDDYPAYRTRTYVRWRVSGAGVTCNTGTSNWTIGNVTPLSGGQWRTGSWGGADNRFRSYTLSCTNGRDTITKTVRATFEGFSGSQL